MLVQDLRAAALPPLRPAALCCAVVPPWLDLPLPLCDFSPPCFEAFGELAIFAARALDIPLSLSASYWSLFLTLADFDGMALSFGRSYVGPRAVMAWGGPSRTSPRRRRAARRGVRPPRRHRRSRPAPRRRPRRPGRPAARTSRRRCCCRVREPLAVSCLPRYPPSPETTLLNRVCARITNRARAACWPDLAA